MQRSSRASVLDPHVRAAWQEQIAAARQRPGLLPEIMRRRDELLPRFAAHYTYLRALPRRMRRALQRQWHMPLAGVALMLALGQSPGLAATIPVNASCTLIDAITAANTDAATGGCPAGSGADTIVLPAGSTQTLTTVNNSTYGPTGLPVISSAITIEGQGSTIRRDVFYGAPAFRIIAVNSTGELTLQETTISGGANFAGGGVFNEGGTVTIMNSTISENIVSDGGGGVVNNGGTVTIIKSTISGNYTSGEYGGGGVRNNSGTVIIMNSTISDHIIDDPGGGVLNFATMIIKDSTIVGNYTTSIGGGVLNRESGTLTIVNSTISGNDAGALGGQYQGGGGIFNAGSLTILSSTISGNTAGYGDPFGYDFGEGGGLSNASTGTLRLAHTIVAGNTAGFSAPEIVNRATVVSSEHNILGVNGNSGVVGFSPGTTDLVPPAGVQLSNILNPVLAFNGGPTQTHALVPGSPAIDAGGPVCTDANGNPLLTDQRGKPRLIDGNGDGTARCDVGAFEFFPVVNNLVTLDSNLDTSFDPVPVPGAPAGSFTITATFTNTSGTALRFPFFTVTELSGGNLLLNADEGTQGVGATVTPNVGDQVLSPGETVQVDFVIGLQTSRPFTFLVDLFAAPLVSGAATSRHRPNTITKPARR